ncbi:hypothetical protein [Okeania sp. SIO1I7]|uniref:hypothetical protein n=1 Tax=Okeania sp. SIO1I7 TaxID=2607772 RepID=UPI0013FC3AC4|nr:hypothetical protein [Okeania sp. SIO1I7]NET29409.1 hypothetical protein [Okeania sp. SIO1I7]
MRPYFLALVKPPKSPKIGGLLEFYSPQNWGARGAKSYPESATPFFCCGGGKSGTENYNVLVFLLWWWKIWH